jgi:acyl dehydratase
MPLPIAGSVRVISRLIAVHPRGKGSAFVETESKVLDAKGNLCVRMINGSFRRGVAGLGDIEAFEGSGQTFFSRIDMPERAPDVEVDAHVAGNQAHIYRLSGDYNPLHIELAAARSGGFDQPILHGLCTLGFCARLLLNVLCDGDPARFGRLRLRFASPVFPGDTLRLAAWHAGPGRVVFECRVNANVVVSNAYFECV